jgi:hypothetical protein
MPQYSLKPISDAESRLGTLLESAPDAIAQLDKRRRDRLQHHRGSISLKSEPGNGICFTFTLPLDRQT